MNYQHSGQQQKCADNNEDSFRKTCQRSSSQEGPDSVSPSVRIRRQNLLNIVILNLRDGSAFVKLDISCHLAVTLISIALRANRFSSRLDYVVFFLTLLLSAYSVAERLSCDFAMLRKSTS